MKVGLCLSGGGIKGVAHIGVIKALEEKKTKKESRYIRLYNRFNGDNDAWII